MEKKYKILSVSSLVPMVVHFRDQSDTPIGDFSVSVRVDYRNDKVYFDEFPEGFDKSEAQILEQQILNRFRPPKVDVPDDYYEYVKKAHDLKSGNYATSFMNQIDGGQNDGRQS